jgi:DNA-directed RNA polymerase subunit K/omega
MSCIYDSDDEEVKQMKKEIMPTDEEEYIRAETEYRKFDEATRRQVLLDFHREIIQDSTDDIQIFAQVVRNEYGTVVDPLHKTAPYLTKYEKAKIIGIRAKQLNQGAKPMIGLSDRAMSSEEIAENELMRRLLPFIIVRPLPNMKKEYWRLDDLEIIEF